MTDSATDRLAELIERKHRCLSELRTLGERQLELAREGQMTELLEVLAYKQRQIGVLQRIEQALDPFRGQIPEQRDWPNAEDRQRCAGQLAECQEMLAAILAQEKRSESELVRRRDDTEARLQGAHIAGQARGAYADNQRRHLGRLDLTSESG